MGSTTGTRDRHRKAFWSTVFVDNVANPVLKKESLEEKQIFQLPEFLTRVESVHVKHRIFTPWHILAWGLRLLGLQGGVTGEYKLPVGRFVLLHNLEVSHTADVWPDPQLTRTRRLRMQFRNRCQAEIELIGSSREPSSQQSLRGPCTPINV